MDCRYPTARGTDRDAKKLIDAGYCHRIMLSHNYSVPKARHGAEVQEERRRANPDGYNFIPRKVLLKLKELGASDEDINQIMVENPRRFFAGSLKEAGFQRPS